MSIFRTAKRLQHRMALKKKRGAIKPFSSRRRHTVETNEKLNLTETNKTTKKIKAPYRPPVNKKQKKI